MKGEGGSRLANPPPESTTVITPDVLLKVVWSQGGKWPIQLRAYTDFLSMK